MGGFRASRGLGLEGFSGFFGFWVFGVLGRAVPDFWALGSRFRGRLQGLGWACCPETLNHDLFTG